VKFLNCVVYEYIFIKRVTEEVKRMLTAVNVNRVFTQFLILVLSHFIEAARTLLLNNNEIYIKIKNKKAVKSYSETLIIINRRDKFTIKNLRSYRVND